MITPFRSLLSGQNVVQGGVAPLPVFMVLSVIPALYQTAERFLHGLHGFVVADLVGKPALRRRAEDAAPDGKAQHALVVGEYGQRPDAAPVPRRRCRE